MFAFLELTEDNVIDIATSRKLKPKELSKIVNSPIFRPERKEEFYKILFRLQDEGYIKRIFKKNNSF